MEHALSLLMKPDNLPIAGMVLFLAVLLRSWWTQAKRHDELLAQGREDEIGREMRR